MCWSNKTICQLFLSAIFGQLPFFIDVEREAERVLLSFRSQSWSVTRLGLDPVLRGLFEKIKWSKFNC